MTTIQLTHNRKLNGKNYASTFAFKCLDSETIEQAFQRLAQAEIAEDAQYGDESTKPAHERHICHQNVILFISGKYHA